jgi:hypothetical protein
MQSTLARNVHVQTASPLDRQLRLNGADTGLAGVNGSLPDVSQVRTVAYFRQGIWLSSILHVVYIHVAQQHMHCQLIHKQTGTKVVEQCVERCTSCQINGGCRCVAAHHRLSAVAE